MSKPIDAKTLPEMRDFYGVESDAWIADKYGASRAFVSKDRKRMGIAACPRRRGAQWAIIKDNLGKMPDAQISDLSGVSATPWAITKFRNRLGIAPFQGRGNRSGVRRVVPRRCVAASGVEWTLMGQWKRPEGVGPFLRERRLECLAAR